MFFGLSINAFSPLLNFKISIRYKTTLTAGYFEKGAN